MYEMLVMIKYVLQTIMLYVMSIFFSPYHDNQCYFFIKIINVIEKMLNVFGGVIWLSYS